MMRVKTVKSSKIKITKTVVVIIVLTVSFLSTNYIQNSNNKQIFVSALTAHGPISITDDSGFSPYPGSGTIGDPYIIEGYNITTTSSIGIKISGTSKHFIINNCYVNAQDYGIHISNIVDGTAKITNNTCEKNLSTGISLSSSNNILSANNCSNNGYTGILLSLSNNNILSANNCSNNDDGIMLGGSNNNILSDNDCSNNNDYGIKFSSSNNNILSANNCSNNQYGIYTPNSGNNILSDNDCSNNDWEGIVLGSYGNNIVSANNCSNNGYIGISLYSSSFNSLSDNDCSNNEWEGILIDSSSSNNILSANNCSNNSYNGIYISQSNYNIIYENFIQDNIAYGVYIYDSSSFNNLIYRNIFYNNNFGGSSQGFDEGTYNQWYDQLLLQGNCWSDWNGSEHYSIDGSANSLDLYPSECILTPPTIESVTHNPSSPTNSDTITISAAVSHSPGIDSVTLHYRINGGEWLVISMPLSTGSIYQATIGPFTTGSVIDYYITAIDSSISHNEAINDNNGSYYSFTVVEVIPEFSLLSPILLFSVSILFLFVVAVLHKRKRK